MGKKETMKEEEREEADLETQQPARGGETMSVVIKGSADKVTKRLGLNEGHGEKEPEAKPDPSASGKFFVLLKERRDLVAVVSRMQPREWEGINCRAEVDRFDLPTTWQDIVDQVRETHGGRKYRVALMDPHTGRTVDAENFTIDADPILPQIEEIGEQFEEEPRELTPLEQVKNLTRKEIESVTEETELARARERLANFKKGIGEGGAAGSDPRVALLEKQIDDMMRRQELKAIEDRHQRELAELKKQIETKPAGADRGDKLLELMMTQIKAQNDLALAQTKSSDEKFSKMMEQMNNQKLDAITNSIRELNHKKEDSGFEKQLAMFKAFADIAGIPLGGEKDDDEKAWYEKLVDELPNIIETLGGKAKKDGKEPTKEDILKEVEAETDRILAARRQAGALPAPPPPPARRPAAPAQTQPPSAAGQLPPPPPDDLGSPTPAAATLPAAAPPSVEEDRSVRCASVLAVLDRELMFRPRQFQWNYIAWQHLPEDRLEAFATSMDLPSAIATFNGICNGDQLAKLTATITADDRVKAWVSRGFKELQEWWQEALKDPDFDPADEEEEEVGA